MDEPKYYTEKHYIGDLLFTFKGEKYPNNPILDTKVYLNEQQLCWISWPQRDEFLKELNDTIEKFRI